MWVMQHFQSAKSWVPEWSTSPRIHSSLLRLDSPFQHRKLSLTIQIWLFSVQPHKCLNHHLNAQNLWQEGLLVVPLETSPGMEKWPQTMRERTKTDFSLNTGDSWYMFKDALMYCKLNLHCSTELSALSNGKKSPRANSKLNIWTQVSSII